MSFSGQLNLSDLDGTNGFVINGIGVVDRLGNSVSNAGDVNGDGVDDLIIGTLGGYRTLPPSEESYVVFGGSGIGSTGTFDLSTLNGSNGFVLNGINPGDFSGYSLSNAGDVNGDGVDDLIIGARGANESYVVFGGSGIGSTGTIELSSLNGTNGFVLNGSGRSVSNAGDVNGDGVDDLIIGTRFANESYVVFGGRGLGSTGTIELSSLNGTNGFVLNGINPDDNSGDSISNAGDVNGDGVDDLIIGAPNADPNGDSSGQTYVVFGGRGVGSTGTIELSSLNGTNGFVLNGINPDDNSGDSISNAGDVNDDGVEDLIIGAPNADPNGDRSGQSYVVFGGSGIGSTGTIELSTLNGTNGFVLNGINTFDGSGRSVSNAGDVNGDGVDDLIIAAGNQKYVVFGGMGVGSTGTIELSSLNGINGFILNGSGSSVSNAGDVNGDGVDDLIIGSRFAGFQSGQTYIVFGTRDNTAPDAVDDSVVTNQNNALSGSVFADNRNGGDNDFNGDIFTVTEVNGTAADVNNQITLASGALLTLNSDGTFDYDPNGQFESLNDGETAIDSFTYTIDDGNGGTDTATVSVTINSKRRTFPAEFNLSDLDGTNSFVINGINPGNFSGSSVSNAGDVNGDGVDDLIIGASGADPNGSGSGQSYVVFGGRGVGSTGTIELSTLNGTNGFVLNGINRFDSSGNSVSNAGDVNGDGVDDLIIGASSAGPNGSGQSYVVFGGRGVGSTGTIELSTLNGTNGFVLNGINRFDSSGNSVSNAGDVNGDGVDDLIIGASGADPNGSGSGQTYVVFGGRGIGSTGTIELSTLNGTNGFVLNGINPGDFSGGSVSNAGDVNGDGVDDLIISASSAEPNGISSGQSYVVFGGSGIGSTGTIELSNLNGTNGFVLNGINPFDRSGSSVSNAGDVNGDGVDDLIIGAPGADPNGSSYVVFGGSGIGSNGTFDLSTLNSTNGFVLNGINPGDFSGGSVSNAGDVNGDGVDDLIIGARIADPNGSYSGQSYVVFGIKENTAPDAVDDTVVTDEDNALTGSVFADNRNGADNDPDGDIFTVTEVNGIAADVNNQITLGSGALLTLNSDGTFDYDPNGQFESLNDGDTASDSFTYTIDDGNGGTDTATVSVIIRGITDITPINEINGTTKSDKLIGTPGRDLIRGINGDDTLEGRGGDDTIEGGRGGDIIRGGAGNDLLAADRVDRYDDFDGKVSELRGGRGNDTIFGARKHDEIGGGQDNDVLFGKRGNDLIRGFTGDDILNGGLGNDTLRGQDGIDTADYSDLTFNGVLATVAGLDVNLSQNTAQHSSNNSPLKWKDTLTTIENVTGTSRNDRFIGNAEDNLFDGKQQVFRNNRQTKFTDLDGDKYEVNGDVVEYSGNLDDFTILGSTDNFTVEGSGIGTDTLIDIEFLKFDDGLFAVDDSLFV